MDPLHILVVDGEITLCGLLHDILVKRRYRVSRATPAENIPASA
jgi:hypothetical protein